MVPAQGCTPERQEANGERGAQPAQQNAEVIELAVLHSLSRSRAMVGYERAQQPEKDAACLLEHMIAV